MAAIRGRPIRIGFQQGIVQLGQLSGGLDINRVFLGRLVAVLSGSRQEERELEPEVGKIAMQGIAGFGMFGGNGQAIRGNQDGRFLFQGALGGAKGIKGEIGKAEQGGGIVEPCAVQNAVRLVRFVGGSGTQLGNSGHGIVGCPSKREAEGGRIERRFGDLVKGVGNLGLVHGVA
jgi:hypothetical protein